MRSKILGLMILVLMPLVAADPKGFVIWPKGTPPGDPKLKLDFGDHTMSSSHRDKDGAVEVHEKMTDILVMQSGEASIEVGGEVVGGKSTGPGEIQGVSIRGGVRKAVGPGDVIHIPAGTPHQFFVAAGKQITYFVVKVGRP